MYYNVLVLFLVFLPLAIEGTNTPACPYPNGEHPAYFPHEDCSKFWQCSYGVPYLMRCPHGLLFNPNLNFCDRSANVICFEANKEISTTPDGWEDESNKCPEGDGSISFYYPDDDCSKFWECSNGEPYLLYCEEGLHFNPVLNVCDWPSRAGCQSDLPSTTIDETSEETSISYSTESQNSTFTTTDDFYDPIISTDVTRSTTEQSSLITITENASSAECMSTETSTEETIEDDEAYTDLVPGSTIDDTSSEQDMDELVSKICEDLSQDEFQAPHPADCTKILFCDRGQVIIISCPAGLWYDPSNRICNYPNQVQCASSLHLNQETS